MKVLQVVGSLSLAHGGVSASVAELSRGLAGQGAAVTIWTTKRGHAGVEDDKFIADLLAAGVTIRIFPVHPNRRLGGAYAYAPQMGAALRKELNRFDLVHLHAVWLYTTRAAAAACRKNSVPYLVSPCGGLSPYGLTQHPWFKRITGPLVERRLLSGAARIHFTSRLEERTARLFGVRARGAVIPRPFRAGQIPPVAAGTFRKQHPELAGRKLLLFLGRLHPKKRPALAAEAFALLARKRNDLQLVLAGPDEGGLASARVILEQAGLLERLSTPGAVHGAEKWALYLDSDLFLLPSEDENFGVAVIEALAAGLPVLVSPSVGVAETVEEAGAGRTAPLNAAAWAATADELLRDPERRGRMGAAGRKLVAERFSTERVAARMKSLYDEILKGDAA
ncbi:MAG: hypothetical protein COV76_02160 [Candidatus Omnitrophica bacterium CG11_big_fil_rev_8_21_14_0_20_64_10]|nr:MAG: hypothetical protein COV76_02160 [Candidatus Omnitrophica bacterium CG11_big_fil_rev_8_21_14_0_20_64_10]